MADKRTQEPARPGSPQERKGGGTGGKRKGPEQTSANVNRTPPGEWEADSPLEPADRVADDIVHNRDWPPPKDTPPDKGNAGR
jgi:hypothetical protein